MKIKPIGGDIYTARAQKLGLGESFQCPPPPALEVTPEDFVARIKIFAGPGYSTKS